LETNGHFHVNGGSVNKLELDVTLKVSCCNVFVIKKPKEICYNQYL